MAGRKITAAVSRSHALAVVAQVEAAVAEACDEFVVVGDLRLGLPRVEVAGVVVLAKNRRAFVGRLGERLHEFLLSKSLSPKTREVDLLLEGCRVRIWIPEADWFGWSVFHRTGPREFISALCSEWSRLKFKDGRVSDAESGALIPVRSEEEIWPVLGIDPIPPASRSSRSLREAVIAAPVQ